MLLTITQQIKDILRPMTYPHQSVKTQEASAPLDRMEAAEDGIEQVGITRTLLEFDKLLIELLENFARFDQKILEDLIIRI